MLRLAAAANARKRAMECAAVRLYTALLMWAAVPMCETLGFRLCPVYDRDISTLYGLNPVGDPILAIGYWLPLKP